MERSSTLIYPVAPAPRTAVLCPGFRSSGRIRVFPAWSEDVARFDPQSLAAPLYQLELLYAIAKPTHLVIVLCRDGDPLLSADARRRLWLAFDVPVFAQLIDRNGKLIAAECEAHDGLHIQAEDLIAEGHEVIRTPCACGKITPRLIEPVTPLHRFATLGS